MFQSVGFMTTPDYVDYYDSITQKNLYSYCMFCKYLKLYFIHYICIPECECFSFKTFIEMKFVNLCSVFVLFSLLAPLLKIIVIKQNAKLMPYLWHLYDVFVLLSYDESRTIWLKIHEQKWFKGELHKRKLPDQNCAGAKSELRMCKNRFLREKGSRTLTPLRTTPHSIIIYCSLLKIWDKCSSAGKNFQFTWAPDMFAKEPRRDRNSGREGVFIRVAAAGRLSLATS